MPPQPSNDQPPGGASSSNNNQPVEPGARAGRTAETELAELRASLLDAQRKAKEEEDRRKEAEKKSEWAKEFHEGSTRDRRTVAKAAPSMSVDAGEDETIGISHVNVENFEGGTALPQDYIRLALALHFFGPLSIYTPEFITRHDHSGKDFYPTMGVSDSIMKETKKSFEVYYALDHYIPYEQLLIAISYIMNLVSLFGETAEFKSLVVSSFMTLSHHITIRNVNPSSYPILRQYAIKKLTLVRDKLETGVKAFPKELFVWDQNLYNQSALQFGPTAAAIGSTFLSTLHSTAPTNWSLLIAHAGEDEKGKKMNEAKEEWHMIQKNVINGEELEGRLPSAISTKRTRSSGYQGGGGGGGGGKKSSNIGPRSESPGIGPFRNTITDDRSEPYSQKPFPTFCAGCGKEGHKLVNCKATSLVLTPNGKNLLLPKADAKGRKTICRNFNLGICARSNEDCSNSHSCGSCGKNGVTVKDCGCQIPDRFQTLLAQYNLLPKYNQILSTLRFGTTLGIKPLPRNSRSYLPQNDIKPEHKEALENQIQTWMEEEKVAGPFEVEQVQSVLGPIQSSPLKIVEKRSNVPGKIRYRVVEDNSHPYQQTSETLPPLNEDLDPNDFPAHFVTFKEIEDHFREAAQAEGSRELDLDKKAAFEVIPLHPSIRHRLVIFHKKKVYIRKNAPFGLRTTPGAFCQIEECTIELVHARFGGGVRAINAMDDLTLTIFDPSIRDEEVIEFIESLGWVLNREKTQLGSRSVVFYGLRWDLNEQTKTLPFEKQAKYLEKVKVQLDKGCSTKVQLKEIESLIGSLQYLTRILPEERPHLRLLYRFRNQYKTRLSERQFRDLELRTLGKWETVLERPTISSTFAAPPPPFPGFFASDASERALGIYVKLEGEKEMTASFSLPDGWKTGSEEAFIANAEAWAIEALLEAVVNLGGGGHSVTLHCDNTNVVNAWENGWSRNALLNLSLLRIFQVVNLFNITLHLKYVASAENPADVVSRREPFDTDTFSDRSFLPNPPPGSKKGKPSDAFTTYAIEINDTETNEQLEGEGR